MYLVTFLLMEALSLSSGAFVDGIHEGLDERRCIRLPIFSFLLTLNRPQLQSTSERICVVPRTHNSFGDRSSSAAGPHVWNVLSLCLRQDMN